MGPSVATIAHEDDDEGKAGYNIIEQPCKSESPTLHLSQRRGVAINRRKGTNAHSRCDHQRCIQMIACLSSSYNIRDRNMLFVYGIARSSSPLLSSPLFPAAHIRTSLLDTLPAVDWGFVTSPQIGFDNRKLHYPRGKCLGGSFIRMERNICIVLTTDDFRFYLGKKFNDIPTSRCWIPSAMG